MEAQLRLLLPSSREAEEQGASTRRSLAPSNLTRACFLFYRKKCVLAVGPRFIPAHPFYQKSHPRSCRQCLRASHPTLLWLWERGLTADAAPSPGALLRKAWRVAWASLFLPQHVKKCKAGFFFFPYFFFFSSWENSCQWMQCPFQIQYYANCISANGVNKYVHGAA